jgi:hypothetical protein
MSALFPHQVTIRDRQVVGEDDFGNDRYETVERTSPAWWEQRASGEQTDARQQVTSGYWLYLPPGTPLTATSQVLLYGEWYEVDGDSLEQPAGVAVDGYVRAALTRTSG